MPNLDSIRPVTGDAPPRIQIEARFADSSEMRQRPWWANSLIMTGLVL